MKLLTDDCIINSANICGRTTRMSVTETMPRLSLPALEKRFSLRLSDPCVRGIAVPRACSRPSPSRSLAQDHAAKWSYLPENTLNFEQCPFQSHVFAACARLTR